VSNFLRILIFFIFIVSCSFTPNSKFWTKEKIILEKQENIIEIFKKDKPLGIEFNPTLQIKFFSKTINKNFLNSLDNNSGRVNYNGNLKNVSRYKFSKIKNFNQYEPELTFIKNNIIFFNNKGTILNFDNDSNLIWKKNYYSKSEKKQKPFLFFANNENYLIVADNIAKLYALDINTGKSLWSKKNTAPFNSQIKIYEDKFFIIDFENILRAYSLKDGNEIWNVKTQDSLIRAQKRLSMVIVDDKIYFNNSLGDISAVNVNSGELIWQTPTQSSLINDTGFFLKTSDIVANNNTLYFSNNQNEFFSVDMQTGTLNWKQEINSNLRPTIIDDYIFTVTLEGYLIIIDKNSGHIIRITDVFKSFNKKYLLEDKMLRSNIIPIGFIVGKNNIYLTTSKGRLLVIDITSGKMVQILKIDNKKISKPFILNQNLYIISNNSIIKLN
jgi:outer membrane protein assembly factor BamB